MAAGTCRFRPTLPESGLETSTGGKLAERLDEFLSQWGREDSNLCRQSQRVYSPSPLTTRTLPRVDRRRILDRRPQAGGAAPRRATICWLKAWTAESGRRKTVSSATRPWES